MQNFAADALVSLCLFSITFLSSMWKRQSATAGNIPQLPAVLRSANVKHFFTLLGKMFFTLYGKEFFTYPGKKIFTSLRLPVGTGQGASAGRIPRGKSNTWHGAGSGPTSQW